MTIASASISAKLIRLVNAILDTLHSARLFSSRDIKSAYWQIPLEEKSKELTADKGFFSVQPYACHLQGFVYTTLGADLEPWAFIYRDDMIIATPDFVDPRRGVAQRIRTIDRGRLDGQYRKAWVSEDELRYLGHIVDESGIRTDPRKVEGC